MVQLGDASAEVDVCWGGFYATEEEDGEGYGVFRLLDFNIEAYHASLYKEKFDQLPTLDQALALTPFVDHVPIDSRQLVRYPVEFIGAEPLVVGDFAGYDRYLEAKGVEDQSRQDLIERLVGFSLKDPVPLHLDISDGELSVTERQA